MKTINISKINIKIIKSTVKRIKITYLRAMKMGTVMNNLRSW